MWYIARLLNIIREVIIVVHYRIHMDFRNYLSTTFDSKCHCFLRLNHIATTITDMWITAEKNDQFVRLTESWNRAHESPGWFFNDVFMFLNQFSSLTAPVIIGKEQPVYSSEIDLLYSTEVFVVIWRWVNHIRIGALVCLGHRQRWCLFSASSAGRDRGSRCTH